MKIVYSIFLALLITASITTAQKDFITVHNNSSEGIIVVIDVQVRLDYGFTFPLTYEFSLVENSSDLQAYKKNEISSEWKLLETKDTSMFFNEHEVVRWDYENNKAFVSVGFGSVTDTIYIKITDNTGEPANVNFEKISPFYDNRDAVVTSSADDMAGWSKSKFNTTITNFRAHHLYLTLGTNTNGMSTSTYDFIQTKLDQGYIEAGCHSRTHPNANPSAWNYDSEITGNKGDLINNLTMPNLYRNGDKEYVYVWIAPNGYLNEVIDSVVGMNHFLVNRLYYNDYFGYPEWNEVTKTYQASGVTRAIDPPRSRLGWGIGSDDINDLNGAFDDAVANNTVYHVMCHPNVVEWDSAYVWDHLAYISNHKNIWYATVGHTNLYHFGETNYVLAPVVSVAKNMQTPEQFYLSQNYPNPFNPTTNISFNLPVAGHIKLTVFNILGEEIAVLENGWKEARVHTVNFDASQLTSGLYFYKIESASFVDVKKMMLVK